MTRPTPQPGDIWRHWEGRLYRILSVDSDRVQYAPANAPIVSWLTASEALDWFLDRSVIDNTVNRFEFVQGDSNG
jgi:hypothetical protein